MPFKGANYRPRLCIPQFNGFVIAGGCQHLTVWAESNAIDPLIVSFQAIAFAGFINICFQGSHNLGVGGFVFPHNFCRPNCIQKSVQFFSFIKQGQRIADQKICLVQFCLFGLIYRQQSQTGNNNRCKNRYTGRCLGRSTGFSFLQ